MTYDEYMREYSCEYKGYHIEFGTIRKNGEVLWTFIHLLEEDPLAVGKAIIDGHERGAVIERWRLRDD
jgi:hypothetical protein